MSHVHAHLMAQYAQDALETDNPNSRWQYFCDIDGEWTEFSTDNSPSWNKHIKYRRKPDQIEVNGIKVNAPISAHPLYGVTVFAAWPLSETMVVELVWKGTTSQIMLLRKGLLHIASKSAKEHCDAMMAWEK